MPYHTTPYHAIPYHAIPTHPNLRHRGAFTHMHLTITPTHAPNYHTRHSVRRHTIMLRLGYFVALFVAPAAALSGETVVGLASTALRLSRRALQDLPSIPGMPSISGIPSIPG